MSNVNADATQLLTILKNMRTSISSIETTRSSVKMKYQQLGIGWNDKKYDELGTIVKDCNKALNDILQIMLQAEKYVASLAKSVQEYDNVGLELATVLDQHISDVPHDGFLSAIYSTHPCNDDRVAALQNLGVPYSRY